MYLGRLEEARFHALRFHELAGELQRRDEENAEWASNVALSYRSLGNVKLSSGDSAGADRDFAKFEEIVAAGFRKEPRNWTRRVLFASALINRAEALLRRGRLAEAESKAKETRRLFEEVSGEKEQQSRFLAWASLLEAEVLLVRGGHQAALPLYEKAELWLQDTGRTEIISQVLRFRVALRTGHDAGAVARELLASGLREPFFLELVKANFPSLHPEAAGPLTEPRVLITPPSPKAR